MIFAHWTRLLTIGQYCFYDTAVKVLELPSMPIKIGKNALLTDGMKIWLPQGLEEIPSGVFKDTGVQAVVVPSSVKEIKEDTFYGCGTLESIVF